MLRYNMLFSSLCQVIVRILLLTIPNSFVLQFCSEILLSWENYSNTGCCLGFHLNSNCFYCLLLDLSQWEPIICWASYSSQPLHFLFFWIEVDLLFLHIKVSPSFIADHFILTSIHLSIIVKAVNFTLKLNLVLSLCFLNLAKPIQYLISISALVP